MGDMLSQAEIDALLNGAPLSQSATTDSEDSLSSEEIDALGEIGNISMGTSATTLFTLLGHKVTITTPRVAVVSWEQMAKEYDLPLVAVKVEYTHGLTGSNLLILKEDDVKVITDLMMGGEGKVTEGELTELHLSAIGEAMNQMVGSAATSMSTMLSYRIDISPPKAFVFNLKTDLPSMDIVDSTEKIVKIAFKMVIGNIVDSEIMQLLPLSFAKSLVDSLLSANSRNTYSEPEIHQSQPTGQQSEYQQNYSDVNRQAPEQKHGLDNTQREYNYDYQREYEAPAPPRRDNQSSRMQVNVQPAFFQPFEDTVPVVDKNNIGIIMDVPLQVTVELGRTHKLIKEILEFGPGSIIELDKLAGEPVDILVNGKAIAKGEVVVIDESFGVRITDIIHPAKRL